MTTVIMGGQFGSYGTVLGGQVVEVGERGWVISLVFMYISKHQ